MSAVKRLYQTGFTRGVHTVIRETNTTFHHKRRNALRVEFGLWPDYLFITHGIAGATNREISNKLKCIASVTVRNNTTQSINGYLHSGCTTEEALLRVQGIEVVDSNEVRQRGQSRSWPIAHASSGLAMAKQQISTRFKQCYFC